MKLIHCSDIHLDSKMESNLSPRQARERKGELCAAFSRLVQYARENGVTAVLIAGDLFDSARISVKTAGFVLDAIKSAPEVDFLYLRGNHDESEKAFSGKELPENLKFFSENWTYYDYDGVTVAGIEPALDGWETMYARLDLSPERTNIVLLHGQEASQAGDELVCLNALRGKHIRYLALGHLHSYKKAPLDLEGEYCYCGCLEGRGFDECGEKGFVLLETGDAGVQTTFVPFAKRTLHEIGVDISGLTSVTELVRAMEDAAKAVPETDMVKFLLEGTYTLETQKDLPFLLQMLENRFYFAKIKDESKLKIEKETYEHDISLKGAFVRMVMAAALDEADKERIICCGIQALSGEEIGL